MMVIHFQTEESLLFNLSNFLITYSRMLVAGLFKLFAIFSILVGESASLPCLDTDLKFPTLSLLFSKFFNL